VQNQNASYGRVLSSSKHNSHSANCQAHSQTPCYGTSPSAQVQERTVRHSDENPVASVEMVQFNGPIHLKSAACSTPGCGCPMVRPSSNTSAHPQRRKRSRVWSEHAVVAVLGVVFGMICSYCLSAHPIVQIPRLESRSGWNHSLAHLANTIIHEVHSEPRPPPVPFGTFLCWFGPTGRTTKLRLRRAVQDQRRVHPIPSASSPTSEADPQIRLEDSCRPHCVYLTILFHRPRPVHGVGRHQRDVSGLNYGRLGR
jgi:hypothetical protein